MRNPTQYVSAWPNNNNMPSEIYTSTPTPDLLAACKRNGRGGERKGRDPPALGKQFKCLVSLFLFVNFFVLATWGWLCWLLVSFYQRDATHSAVFATATCPSVCLSLTRQTYQSESRIVKCTLSDSHMILLSGKEWLVEKNSQGVSPKKRAKWE